MRPVSIALLHHPVLDRAGVVVTTAITNLDVHDISRSARAFGCANFFVVHPILAQRELCERIRDHWVTGSGKKRIPDRADAIELVRTVTSFEDVLQILGGRASTEVMVTAARSSECTPTPFVDARARLDQDPRHLVLCFGTGWGLSPDFLNAADVRLEPITPSRGAGWNHLSVRAACAIVLDRLFG